jgi:23S rRNA (uridine2552-2'-O)-methyltransferase
LRSRAVYKLEELIERDRLLKPGITWSISAPPPAAGRSWCASAWAIPAGSFALDILPMQSIAGVDFLQGDFREESVLRELEAGWTAKGWILCCAIWPPI